MLKAIHAIIGSDVLNNQRELANSRGVSNGSHLEQAANDEAAEDSDVSLDVDVVSEVSECTTVSLLVLTMVSVYVHWQLMSQKSVIPTHYAFFYLHLCYTLI